MDSAQGIQIDDVSFNMVEYVKRERKYRVLGTLISISGFWRFSVL